MSDGVSIVADRWAEILAGLGWNPITVAGEGPVDHLIPGLELGADHAPSVQALDAALGTASLVVVENLGTIPMNLPASRVVLSYLAGRPAIMHHHDPPWQRDRFAHITELPVDDPAWVHVTINDLTRQQMSDRGFRATTIYNPFPTTEAPGDRAASRARLGIGDDRLLVAHPVRAISRKNIPVALRLAEELKGTYWLLGPTEEGYVDHVDWLLSTATVPTLRRPETHIPDIYAAGDVVVFPSLWEGFGNPPIEASIHHRPVIVGDYPVAAELEALGFEWYRPHQLDMVHKMIAEPDEAVLESNAAVAHRHFSMAAIGDQIQALIQGAGWT